MLKIWRPIEHVSLRDSEGSRPEDARLVGRDTALLSEILIQISLFRLSDWFDGLKSLRAMFNGGTGPLNEKLVDRVERSVKDFFERIISLSSCMGISIISIFSRQSAAGW